MSFRASYRGSALFVSELVFIRQEGKANGELSIGKDSCPLDSSDLCVFANLKYITCLPLT